MSWGFVGTDFFSAKSSNAKYKTQGTSEANFGGKKNAYNTQGSTVLRKSEMVTGYLHGIISFSGVCVNVYNILCPRYCHT